MDATKPIHAKPALYAFYYESLKVIAKQYGYALLLHGSMNRDLDLVAVPWINGAHATDIKKMIYEMGESLGVDIGDILPPHQPAAYGREQWIINLNRGGYYSGRNDDGEKIYSPDPQYYIDISVMPIIENQKQP